MGSSYYWFLFSTSCGTAALWIGRMALSWYAVQQTSSATTFAAMMGIAAIAEVYATPVLAPLADFFDRLRVYRIAAALVATLALALWFVVTFLPFSVPALTGLLVVLGLLAAARDPAAGGLVPSVVPAAKLMNAQSFRASASMGAQLAGSVVGASLVSYVGISGAVGVMALLLGAAYVASGRIRLVGPAANPPGGWRVYRATWAARAWAGVRAVWLARSERLTALAAAVANIGIFTFTSILIPLWVAGTLRAPASLMGVLLAAMGVGVIAGGMRVTSVVSTALGRFNAAVAGLALSGSSIAAAAWVGSSASAVALMVAAGLGLSLFMINTSTLRAAATPASFRARMVGGVAFVSACLHPFLSMGAGSLVDAAGVTTAILVSAGCVLAAAALLCLNRDARTLFREPDDALSGAYSRLYPQAFDAPKENDASR